MAQFHDVAFELMLKPLSYATLDQNALRRTEGILRPKNAGVVRFLINHRSAPDKRQY